MRCLENLKANKETNDSLEASKKRLETMLEASTRRFEMKFKASKKRLEKQQEHIRELVGAWYNRIDAIIN